MKIVRLIIATIAILFTLFFAILTPWALIGTLIAGLGIYLSDQKQKGYVTFSKPGWITASGLIVAVILTVIFAEPVEETAKETATKTQLASKEEKNEEKEKAQEEAEEKKAAAVKKEAEEKKAAEAKAKEEAAAKAKVEEEAKVKEAAEAKAKAEAKEKQQKEIANKFNLEAVTVYRAVDGDTLELSDGRRIRLVGVNTPETTTRHEQYGKEASNYTSAQLTGKKVWMQKDVSDTDRYNRYLRLIWLSLPTDVMSEKEIREKMFNAKLVLNGYAEPSTYSPDVKYSDYFVKFAREARAKKTGLWAYGSNGTTKGDLDPKKSTTTASTTPSKPSSSTSSVKPATKPAPKPAASATPAPKAEFFQNCTELRKVYPNGVPSTHPAYAPKHDRDKDNYACER
ncbi:thermonuclease family protein [Fictibacillus phosphorivorans]|uniref:thermonuclease family protein n=1 Tax=Fictibacillus phosphorivorans TaxID=1221500 RepID=UPI00203DD7B0|nr:thermonuclease family protein [Fictibacillus phosphorivorans]MCM3718148.1 thermonuclease family protein [Fictibacillus phosphorivorans]MCM3775775.1 thermonuclease family protein [Fictibacillus phosphorivorans]